MELSSLGTKVLRDESSIIRGRQTCSRSSMIKASLSELGSAPRLGVDSCVGGSETRSTAGTRDSERYQIDTVGHA